MANGFNFDRAYGSSTMGGGLGSLAGGLMGLFNYKNPMDSAYPYMNQIPGMIQQGYGSYAGLGGALSPLMGEYSNLAGMRGGLQNMYGQMTNNNLGTLQSQYGQMAGNLPAIQGAYGQLMHPGEMISELGKGFQASPGYKYQVEQAQKASNQAAAAGGMLGSPAQQQAIAEQIGGMANQDYNNYLNRAQGLYGAGLSGMQGLQSQGLQGLQGLFSTGLAGQQGMHSAGLQGLQGLGEMGMRANEGMTNSLRDYLMSRSSAEYAGAQNHQQAQGQNWNNILGGLGSLITGGLFL